MVVVVVVVAMAWVLGWVHCGCGVRSYGRAREAMGAGATGRRGGAAEGVVWGGAGLGFDSDMRRRRAWSGPAWARALLSGPAAAWVLVLVLLAEVVVWG